MEIRHTKREWVLKEELATTNIYEVILHSERFIDEANDKKGSGNLHQITFNHGKEDNELFLHVYRERYIEHNDLYTKEVLVRMMVNQGHGKVKIIKDWYLRTNTLEQPDYLTIAMEIEKLWKKAIWDFDIEDYEIGGD